MIFGKKIIDNSRGKLPSGLWAQLRKTTQGKFAITILGSFVFLAVFGDFIANEKPFYAKRNGHTEFPIIKGYLVDLGWASFDAEVFQKGWRALEYEKVIWAPIPYSASGLDFENDRFRSPFGPQVVNRKLDWHWLGTDQLGRDVAAGIISGARSALLVGLIAMGIASLIGISIGAIAGFFGDNRLTFTRWHGIFLFIGLFLGLFWLAYSNSILSSLQSRPLLKLITGLALLIIPISLFGFLGKHIDSLKGISKRITLPIDLIVMRIIEVINAIPGLLLLLALIALVKQPNIYTVMLIIGLLSWTGITRFMRGELLKIRNLPFIQSAESMGFSSFRILFRHALPNAMGPVIVTITFGMAGAILAEAALSYIGIATSTDTVTWGTLLNEARNSISAWWLAIFPGLMIFLLISSLNIIGDRISGVLDITNTSQN